MPWAYTGTRLALILRRLRGRFGISAPQVTVRSEIPGHLRILAVLFVAIALIVMVLWSYDAGRQIAGFNQGETSQVVEQLRSHSASLEEEVVRLRSLLTASESGLQIERAAQKLLSEKHDHLVQENNKLKEELAVFERLAKFEGKRDDEVALDQVSVKADASKGRYLYSFLISLQGARRGKETRFNLQLVVTSRGERAGAKITLPRREETDPGQYEIVMRNFRRIDGRFSLPADIDVGAVEIRILEAGTLKASRSVTF